MWYGFYGAVLADESSFELKMSELCRDLGDRGRGAAAAAASSSPSSSSSSPPSAVAAAAAVDASPTGGGVAGLVAAGREDTDEEPGIATLRAELDLLNLRELRNRAIVAGVHADAVEDARDSEHPKKSLILLIIARDLEIGAAGRVLALLRVGGEEAMDLVMSVLEHATVVMESLSLSSPRKERKALRQVLDRVESVEEMVDVQWVSDASLCDDRELEQLASVLANVEEMVIGSDANVCTATVVQLLDCVERCGSTVVRAAAVLSSAVGEQSDEACMLSLEGVRMLPVVRQEEVSSEEMSAAVAILGHTAKGRALTVRAAAHRALFTLCCRNGLAMCTSEGVWEVLNGGLVSGLKPMVEQAGAGHLSAEALHLAGCYHLHTGLVVECVGKCPSARRPPLDSLGSATARDLMATLKPLADEKAMTILSMMMDRKVFEGDDTSLACAYGCFAVNLLYTRPHMASNMESIGGFQAAWTRHHDTVSRVTTDEWWSSTSAVVDIIGVHWTGLIALMMNAARSLPWSTVTSCSWFGPLLDECI
eukprot:SAG11_NODE_5219_length_1626_cov_187.516699_1_plen_536_part_10